VRLSINQASASNTRNPREGSAESSASEDDVVPDADEDYSANPAATQYEIMRDNGFKHLDNPDEDDDRATQRFLARSQLLGDNHASDNAIIMEITCYNFMCHTRLHVEFGPLINFVVGMNGSGKSAVLTAVTLCLGGKAASTNRGASMKTLIKTGEDQAVLKVRLKNKGNDAYQPDVFGASIIVERHFSRSGTGGYKLKNDNGKTISTKKSDVDDMIEYYQLMVDNPMNVLTQDAAKSFITSSTPAQKYKFFVEGVQLEALDNDYKLVADTMDQIASNLRDSEDDLAALEKDRDDAKKKADMIEERSGLRAAAKLLQCQCAWSQVEEVELTLRKKEEELEAAKEVIKMQEKRAEEEAQKYEEANNTLERWKQVQTQLEVDAAPVQEEYENAKNLQKDIQTELLRLKGERDNVKQNVKTFENKVKSYKNDLRAEMQRLLKHENWRKWTKQK
jgi:chromosome segregation ATPase